MKTNTNIYYNVKVDNSASKAIHYCLTCSNYNCKAIHKSICKSLEPHVPPHHNHHHHHNNQQQSRLSFNKSSSTGPNINFIFERRYPTAHHHHQHSSNNNNNLNQLLSSILPNNGNNIVVTTTSTTTNTTPTLSPNQQRNRQSSEINSFPLPLSPLSSTNLSISFNNNNDIDFLNLLNLTRSFRNITNNFDQQVNAWNFHSFLFI